MTFFKPERRSIINYAIFALIGALMISSFMVVWIYNRSVNIEHGISAAELNIRSIQTEKAQLQDKIFALLSGVNVQKFSKDRNLVDEKNPQSVKTGNQAASELAVSQAR